MKEITAIIKPQVLGRVVKALHELPHFPGLTLSDVHGQGRGLGAGGSFVLTEENLFFHPEKKVEIIASDDIADSIVAIIRQSARTGTNGDGIITVKEITRTLRIRRGEAQNEAL
jgi:nitrogen regulatory protein P-II 1